MTNTIYQFSRNYELVKQSKCFGIDLGTTSTLFCYIDSKNIDLKKTVKIPVTFLSVKQFSPFEIHPTIDDVKTASIVAIHNGRPYIGYNLYFLKGHKDFIYKKNMFYHWKLDLGIDEYIMYPDAIIEGLNMPFKIAGGILKYIKRQHYDKEKLYNTIITVPASFQANQRLDVIKAAELADINTTENMLIDEPNAAFLGYFNRLDDFEKQKWANEVRNKNILIIDFGGGTLDLSLLNVDFRKDTGIAISNIAISRFNDLGGQDIDHLIAEEILYPIFKNKYNNHEYLSNIELAEVILPQLAVIGENLKTGICNKISLFVGDSKITKEKLEKTIYNQDNCKIFFNEQEIELGNIRINGIEFDELFNKIYIGKNYQFKFIDKTITTIGNSINQIIEKANFTLLDIQYVLYVGGSSHNPLIKHYTVEKLSQAFSLITSEPDKLVAEGAAVYSYFLNVHNVSLIKPITSETIGVMIKDNRFHPIIEKGMPLPQDVTIPDFKLQTNLIDRIEIPVCINAIDFSIGTITCNLNKFYDIDTDIKINATITPDKIFKIKVYADNDLIGNGVFENPFSTNELTENEREIISLKREINKAKSDKNLKNEKENLRSLIFRYFDIENYLSCIEHSELYLKKFDDQDATILNYLFCSLNRIGRNIAAKDAILKAIQIRPDESTFHYNYSILLDDSEALKYLDSLKESLKNNKGIKCRIIILKNKLGIDVKKDAMEIVNEYKENPSNFSSFEKSTQLIKIFKIVNEPYSFIPPTDNSKKIDSKYLLDTNNLPF